MPIASGLIQIQVYLDLLREYGMKHYNNVHLRLVIDMYGIGQVETTQGKVLFYFVGVDDLLKKLSR